jgi:signal transduction histidine kinase/ActR/RegA family two-component response regulator
MTDGHGQASAASAGTRILVHPPTRRDGQIVESLLAQAGLTCTTCSTLAGLCAEIDDGTAAIVLTDDVLDGRDLSGLRDALRRQPQWSDVPFVVLAAGGMPTAALSELQSFASVTLLDRSVHMRTLLSAVEMAVRARTRQYQIRDLLERESQARLAADQANAAKDRFLAMLSHELRTPLTPIVFAVAALQREFGGAAPGRRAIDARLPRMLDMISRNIAVETKLIDDLLDLSRMVQGKLHLQRDLVDMHARVRDTLSMVEADVAAKRLTIETRLEAARSFVMGDAARIDQVLWNLLKNAVKFTPEGGTIRLRTRDDGEQIVLTCEDTGIGLSPDILPRLFEPFEQGSAEITRRYGGLGLGLAVGRSLVLAHGGSLTATSDGVGTGATFTVVLPTTAARGAGAAPTEVQSSEPALRRCLDILLVEDHPDTAHALGESLTSRGHRVRVVSGVQAALREAASAPCELLISDIGLPDGSGIDVIRQMAPGPTVGAIAMSGFAMEQDVLRSREAGFHVHLTKPVELAVLERAIAEMANGERRRTPAAGRRPRRRASRPG